MVKRKIPPEQQAELRRAIKLLAAKIRDADLTFREVSRRLGWPKDRLSHVLKGRLLLRFEDLYAILAMLELPPVEFFAELGRSHPRWAGDPLLGDRNPYDVLIGGMTRGELFDEIRRAIRHELDVREERDAKGRQAEAPSPGEAGAPGAVVPSKPAARPGAE